MNIYKIEKIKLKTHKNIYIKQLYIKSLYF
jgi:hypothetical protein